MGGVCGVYSPRAPCYASADILWEMLGTFHHREPT